MSTYAAILVPLKKILCLIFCERVGQFECCIFARGKKVGHDDCFFSLLCSSTMFQGHFSEGNDRCESGDCLMRLGTQC